MKLSEIKGERALDVVAEILPLVFEIAQDKEFIKAVQKDKQNIGGYLPILIINHKQAIIRILAYVKGITPEEYAEQMTVMSIFNDAMELFTDRSFSDFLSSPEPAAELNILKLL